MDNHATVEERQQSLMRVAGALHEYNMGYDAMCITGGEPFPDDGCYREWFCMAETIRHEDKINTVFIESRLTGDVDALLDFMFMVNNKDMQVCTNYHGKGCLDYDQWASNVKEVQKAGYKVTVTAMLTSSFIDSDLDDLPDGVEFRLVPPVSYEKWLAECKTPQEYNRMLRENAIGLPLRRTAMRWFQLHPDLAKGFAEDKGMYARATVDRKDDGYEVEKYLPAVTVAECGDPYTAYCYADSEECAMCDARNAVE